MKNLLPLFSLFIFLPLGLMFSCQRSSKKVGKDYSLSSIKVNLPEIPNINYSGFYFSIQKNKSSVNDRNCSENFETTLPSSNTSISHKVKNNCNYLVILELGNLDSNGSSLEKALYSNRINGSFGYAVDAPLLKGGEIVLTLELFRTNAAQSDSKKPGDDPKAPPEKVETPLETSLNVNVIVAETSTPVPSPTPAASIPPTTNEVVFTIKPGTGSGSWNTVENTVVVKLGQKLTVINNDTIAHQVHADPGKDPFNHGQLSLAKGQKETFIPTKEFDGSLRCHIHENAKFYLKVIKP